MSRADRRRISTVVVSIRLRKRHLKEHERKRAAREEVTSVV